jgi:hypothetical protein
MYQQHLNVKAFEIYRITSKINFKLLWCQRLSKISTGRVWIDFIQSVCSLSLTVLSHYSPVSSIDFPEFLCEWYISLVPVFPIRDTVFHSYCQKHSLSHCHGNCLFFKISCLNWWLNGCNAFPPVWITILQFNR